MPIISASESTVSGDPLGTPGLPIHPSVTVYSLLHEGRTLWQGNMVDSVGAYWTVEQVDGWTDSPDARLTNEPRTRNDGSFDDQHFYSARLVTLSGKALFPDMATLREGQRALAAVLSARSATLTVNDGLLTLSADVRLAGPVRSRMPRPLLLEWQIEVLAPDPRKYGPEQYASTGLPVSSGGLTFPLAFPLDFGAAGATGRVTLVNDGTADTWPTFTVTGPLPGFELTRVETGERLRYTGSLAAGQSVVLDASTGAVLLEGTADRRQLLTAYDWFAVPAGGVAAVQFSSLGSADPAASLSAAWRPAYW